LGPDEGHRLADRVSEVIANRSADSGNLTAADVCAVCGASPSARVKSSRVVVKDVFGSTLIEKQTCPTAISFWRWIAVKWPKYAPREHRPFAEEDEEWKRLALLVASCLLLGAVAAAADAFNRLTALGFYAAAYVCGGWDAAEDAWARFRQGRLDVHFLMLAVAAGARVIGAWREGALLKRRHGLRRGEPHR
jgi:Cd2+/Zn2+-exporting ATPase